MPTQKELLENLTGEKMPEPTPQEYHREQLEGTPFWIIQNKTGYNLIMGKYRMNNTPLETLNELHAWMDKNKWNIQMSIAICVVTDMLANQNKQ